ncbi:arginine and glutamate-rich protein 1-B-like isoform X2 [Ptychodera flava]|uniref:arginine and glutamate-rich protein 1-B-like isoform X2 n=1 Tax=Ptychodera flava TaxID=63121 RepID=UPI00396A698B
MADRSGTALPHILQEYKPDYSQDASASVKPQRHPETTHNMETEHVPSTSASPVKESHSERDHGKSPDKNKTGRQSPRKLQSREDSSMSDSRFDQQRREENYQKWQEFKTINRDQEFSKLKKKVALQHKLIQKRDELHAQRTEEDRMRQAELREAEKHRKLEMEEELLQKCKESLELDKQRKAARHAQLNALKAKREDLRTADGIEPIPHRPLSVVQSRSGDAESQVS